MVELGADTKGCVSIVVPCKAEYVALCRLVAGALGGREALDEEVIADLKVVVTEVCNCFLSESGACTVPAPGADVDSPLPGPSATLRLDFRPGSDIWEITASNPDRRRRILPDSLCDPVSEGGLGLMIIRALVDSVELTDDDARGSVLRLVMKLSPEEGSSV